MVRPERAGDDARHACRDPAGRRGVRGLDVPGDGDGVAHARSCAHPVGAATAVGDVDADRMHAAISSQHLAADDLDQQRRVLHGRAYGSSRRRDFPFVRRRELAAHSSLVDAPELGDRLPGSRSVEPAQVRFLGDPRFVRETEHEVAGAGALHDGAHPRCREPIDDLDHVERVGPDRGVGLLAHSAFIDCDDPKVYPSMRVCAHADPRRCPSTRRAVRRPRGEESASGGVSGSPVPAA